MSKTILLTGANGFLGKQLLRNLKSNHQVISIGGRTDFASQVEKVFRENTIDTVIHAGFDVDFSPASAEKSENVLNTQILGEAAKKHRVSQFIFLSAAGVMGTGASRQTRGELQFGETDGGFEGYRNTKYISEKIDCETFLREKGLPLTCLYLTTVYGPEMECETAAAIRKRRLLALCPPGGTSFLALSDFLNALNLVLEKRVTGGFILSSGNTSYYEIFRTAARLQGYPLLGIFVLPMSFRKHILSRLKKGLGKILSVAVIESAFGYKYFSPERARHTLGWSPRESLESAIRSVLATPSA